MPVTNANPFVDNDILSTEQTENKVTDTKNNVDVESSDSSANAQIKGLSEAEQNDPNSIQVTVADTTVPLIVLFGPPACGKTMTLVRLTRHLQSEGYTIAPVRTFRPTSDKNYAEICDNFDYMINSSKAAQANDRISFMLIEVIKNGRRLCQILEAPGEFYFNPKKPNDAFPNYVNTIIASSNRKIWTIMTEPKWLDYTDRMNYVTKITRLKQQMRARDSVVFMFNKIDETNFVRTVGDVNVSEAIKEVKNLYPNIFVPFMNQNPVTRILKEYNCDFVPFQTGTYTKALNGVTYQEGPREYCNRLWKVLMSKIKG